MRIGFHPAPWLHGQPPQTFAAAVAEIAACGWDGLELCNSQAAFYPDRPEDIRDALDRHGLALATYYCGQRLFPGFDMDAALAVARRHVDCNALCGSGLVALDGGAWTAGADDPAHISRIAEYANRAAALARERGLACSWHQHYGTVFDDQQHFEQFMDETDPALVGFCPDAAQLALSGFDVEAVWRRHLDRINYTHFKDVEFLDGDGRREPGVRRGGLRTGAGCLPRRDYNMREPGRGVLDFPRLFGLLRSAGYDGWIVVDLDYTLTTPGESCRYAHDYLRAMIG